MFFLEVIHDSGCQRLKVGFVEGVTATNAEYLPYVTQRLGELAVEEPMMGPLLKINGPCTLPIGFAIAHKVCHLYGAVAVFDPKLDGYVVVCSHGSEYKIGDVLSDKPIIV